MESVKPLQGIKVIDFSAVVAGPGCGRMLADWGADVIKVEETSGEYMRHFSQLSAPIDKLESPLFELYNANKRSIALNAKTEEGHRILLKLLEGADVFITNTREKSLKVLGLDYESLKDRFPGLVHASVTGFGDAGPRAAEPGFDQVAFWAASGFLADFSVDVPGSYPVYAPGMMGDMSTGVNLFGAVCAALVHKAHTGQGDRVTVSLYGTAIWLLSGMITARAYGFPLPKKRYTGGNPMILPYRCAGDDWVMLSANKYSQHFPRLCGVLSMEDLVDDPRYATIGDMLKNAEYIIRRMEERFASEPFSYWKTLLLEADVPFTRLNHMEDIPADEQAISNHYVQSIQFLSGNSANLPRPTAQSDNLGIPPYERAPFRGEHTADILKGLGYTESEINDLEEKEAILCDR